MPIIKAIPSRQLGSNYHEKKLLYQFVKDCNQCCRNCMDIIPSGTIHIGKFIETSRRFRTFEDYDMLTDTMHFRVYYSKLPAASTFTNVYDKNRHVDLIYDEIRVYDIGDIGEEITESNSPEQVAEKYFGRSDFSIFFEHEALSLFSKQMALSRTVPRNMLQHPNLTFSSHVYSPYTPSRFKKFKQAISTSGLPTAISCGQAAFMPAIRSALGYSTPEAFYYACAAAPFVYGLDLHESNRRNETMRKNLMLSPSDRSQLVIKGAMTTQLAKRLTQHDQLAKPLIQHNRHTLLSRIHSKKKQRAGKTKQANRIKKYKSRKNNSKTKKKQNKLRLYIESSTRLGIPN